MISSHHFTSTLPLLKFYLNSIVITTDLPFMPPLFPIKAFSDSQRYTFRLSKVYNMNTV